MKTFKSPIIAAVLCAASTAWANPVSPAVVATGASLAAAQTAAPLPEQLGLTEFLALVRSHHPVLRTMPLRSSMDATDVRAAGIWENPSVQFSHQPGEREWGVEIPLPIFGQPALRTQAAELRKQANATEMQAQVQTIMVEAARSFAELLIAQEKQATQQRSLQLLDDALRVVQGQIALGARSQYDGVRIAILRARMQAQLKQQSADTDAARSALAQLLAQPRWQPSAVGSLKAQFVSRDGATSISPTSFDALWQQTQHRLAALQAAQANVRASEQQMQLQARETLPTPSLGISRVRNRPDNLAYNVVGVSFELPLFDRKQAARERAALEHAQALADAEVAQHQAFQRLQQAYAQHMSLQKTLQSYEQEALHQLQPLQQMAQDSYRLGQSSILEWIDTLESLQELQQEHLDLLLRVWQADIELAAASGLPWLAGQ